MMGNAPNVPARWSTLAALFLVAGCGTEPSICGGGPCRTTAIANVYVRDASDQPVAGVGLSIRTYLQVCGLDLRGGEESQVTLPDGHRRIEVTSLNGPHTVGCIALMVNPTMDPAFPSGSKEFEASLEFRIDDGGRTPRDSVRLDIVVP